MQNYILSYFFGFLVITIFYFVGQLLRGNTLKLSLFNKLIVGSIFFTTIYALIISGFTSYLIIIPVLVIYNIIINRKSYNLRIKDLYYNLRGIPLRKELFSITLPLYSISFLIFTGRYMPEIDGYLYAHPDFSFYAAISEILNQTGIESRLFDPALNGTKHFVFYHYFELWLNAAISRFTGFTSLFTIIFILIPVLVTVLLVGVFEYLKTFYDYFINKFWLTILLSVSTVFLFPYTITLRWLLNFGNKFDPWNPSIAMNTSIKWSIVATGLLYLVAEYKTNKLKNIPIILAFLAVIYPTTMIAIFPSLLLWSLYLILNKNYKLVRDNISVCLIIVAGMMYVNLFGSLPKTGNVSTLDYVISFFTEDTSKLILFIKEPLLRSLYILFAFSPFLILLFFVFKRKGILEILKKYKDLIIILSILYITSVFGVVLLEFTYDGDQIHRNIFYPLYILMTLFFFLKLFSASSKIKKISISLLIITILLNVFGVINYHEKFEKPVITNKDKIIDALNKENSNTVFISSEEALYNKRRKHPYFVFPGYNLRFYVKNYFPKTLSLDKIKIETLSDKQYLEEAVKTTEFYDEVVNQGKSYKDIIDKNDNIDVLIIDNRSKEFNDFKMTYNLEEIGQIDEFVYFKLSDNEIIYPTKKDDRY